MLSFYHPLSLLNIFLFCNFTVANRFAFSIQEIHVGNTVGRDEDDLTLALVASTGVQNFTQTFALGGDFTDDTTIRWDNLTLEIDLGNEPGNLSVLYGLVNNPDHDEVKTQELVDKMLDGAFSILGLFRPLAIFVGIAEFLVNFFSGKCAGPAASGNSTFSVNTLATLKQNQRSCQNATSILPLVSSCGFSDSNYTVTYCLERLDAKNAAGNTSPQSAVYMSAILVALAFSAFF